VERETLTQSKSIKEKFGTEQHTETSLYREFTLARQIWSDRRREQLQEPLNMKISKCGQNRGIWRFFAQQVNSTNQEKFGAKNHVTDLL